MVKICNKCNIEKHESEFYKCKSTKDGLQYVCKVCMNQYQIQNKQHIEQHNKQWRLENLERISKNSKQWYENNIEYRKKYIKQYRKDNDEYIKNYQKKYNKQWNKSNSEYHKQYQKLRKKIDVNYKLAHNLRRRLWVIIKRSQKSGSPVRDLGCSVEELKIYIEKQFKPGMTWENWTTDGWHIDHVIPLSSFDLTDREQFLKACHYTNLQPLWAEENLKKGNKL